MAGTKTQVQTGQNAQNYTTSFGQGGSPSFLSMYGATSGNDTASILDKIISGQLAAKESYLPKLQALNLKAEAEKQDIARQEMQKQLIADAQQAQAEQGAIGGAIKAGSMLMGKMSPSRPGQVGPTATATQAAPTPTVAPEVVAPASEVTPSQTATPNIGTPASITPEVATAPTPALPSASAAGSDVGGASTEGQIQSAKEAAIQNATAKDQGDLLNNIRGQEVKFEAKKAELARLQSEAEGASAHEMKDISEKADSVIKDMGVIQGVGQQRVRDLKTLGSGAIGALIGGINLATTLSGDLQNLDVLDIANTGLGAAGTVGNLAKMGGEVLNNQAIANLGGNIGQGVGAIAAPLGIASGVKGIMDDPSNPVGYTNTGMAAINAVPIVADLLAPAVAPVATGAATGAAAGEAAAAGTTAAAAPTSALGAASSAASAVALPLALIAAGEAGRGAWGGQGKTWDDKNSSERMFDNPGMTTLNPGYVIGSLHDSDSAVGNGMRKLGLTNEVVGDFAKASGAMERISMAPIDWLFSGNINSTKDAWADLADIFGW